MILYNDLFFITSTLYIIYILWIPCDVVTSNNNKIVGADLIQHRRLLVQIKHLNQSYLSLFTELSKVQAFVPV
jgi:hypothetical protein